MITNLPRLGEIEFDFELAHQVRTRRWSNYTH